MTGTRNLRRGSALLEFTLVGIPVLFVLISIFEVARGMWIYHTLAHAAREGTRFVIVHGKNCGTLPSVCDKTVAESCCKRTVGEIAAVIRDAGAGLLPDDLTVEMQNLVGPNSLSSVGPKSLKDCLIDTNEWPKGPGSLAGNDIAITLTYPFRSAIALFWPGAGAPVSVGSFNLPASSRDRIQY